MKKSVFLYLILLVVVFFSHSQTCTQRLNLAEDDYEAGRLLGIPDRLNDCLVNRSFSKEEEVRARKLLTLVYIFTDNEALAEVSLINLLKADPEHILDPQIDPAEIFFLYNQFRVDPIFRLGLRVGVNLSQVNVITPHATSSLSEGSNFYKYYNGNDPDFGVPVDPSDNSSIQSQQGAGIGFNVELTAERHLFKGIEVGLGAQWRSSQYTAEQFINNPDLNATVTSQHNYLRVPLLFRYTLGYEKKKTIEPYVMVGTAPDFLISAQYTSASRAGGTAFTLSDDQNDIKAAGLVENLNFSIFGGIGAKIRLATHFITVEARYDNSRLNLINGDNRFTAIRDVVNDLQFVEDDLSLDFISFSIGYTRSIYKPQKKKEFR